MPKAAIIPIERWLSRGTLAGPVNVNDNLSKSGGSFKIDHPQNPANKYLYHSFVESPDMKNIYDGTITTDATGFARVTMPESLKHLIASSAIS